MRGRIDRVDTNDGMALVLDYKGQARRSLQGGQLANRFQAALYMLSW